MKMKLLTAVLLICFLAGCAAKEAVPSFYQETNIPINSSSTGVGMEKSAKYFVELFCRKYPTAYITKVRWQLVPDGSNTYIIEGIQDGNKYILKLLAAKADVKSIDDIAILGQTERPLKDSEIAKGKAIEQPLKLEEYISVDQIFSTALQLYDSVVQEWKVVWVDGKEIIQVILWGDNFEQKFVVLDARSGKLMRQMP